MDAGCSVYLDKVKKVKDPNKEHHFIDRTLFGWRDCVLPVCATMDGETDGKKLHQCNTFHQAKANRSRQLEKGYVKLAGSCL